MQYYLAATYHGPLVYGQGQGFWTVASPFRPTERYDGALPPSCLESSEPVTSAEARRVLGLESCLPAADPRRLLRAS